jgi:hypothetical protein
MHKSRVRAVIKEHGTMKDKDLKVFLCSNMSLPSSMKEIINLEDNQHETIAALSFSNIKLMA